MECTVTYLLKILQQLQNSGYGMLKSIVMTQSYIQMKYL